MALRGNVARLTANIEAIRLLKRLEAEDRNPSTNEKRRLAQYVGWGGLAQVFDEAKAEAYAHRENLELRRSAGYNEARGFSFIAMAGRLRQQAQALENWHSQWGKWHDELKELLSPEEYAAAAASTINAHYTSKEVIGAMWKTVERLGFKGGHVLEPAGGVGHFFGLMPESLADTCRMSAVELDSISGRILRKLYPETEVQVTAFQEAQIPDHSVDLAISNVPFANVSVFDPAMEAARAPDFSLHNYFFAKALQKVRPGGLIAFVTTSHTLDSNLSQRHWLAGRSEFIGAMRLPNTAFKGSANTEVVTDIIFLRKPDGTPPPFPVEDWIFTAKAQTSKGEPIDINGYFARHPEMILGQLDNDGKMYGGKADEEGQMTVHPHPDMTLEQSLNAALERLPANVIGNSAAQNIPAETPDESSLKPGTLTQRADGSISIAGSSARSEEIQKPKHQRLAADFIRLRDTLNELYRQELDPASNDNGIEAQRTELNSHYDAFVYRHGPLHKHESVLGVDPDFYRLLGTEVEKKPEAGQSIAAALSRKKIWRKGDVFTRRVLTPRTEPARADTLGDALGISLGWRGRLDTGFMSALLNREPQAVEADLLRDGLAFRNPATGLLETREEYLSGNVRVKLRVAGVAAQSEPAFAVNVEELRRVHPEEIKIEDIRMKLGSAWIPAAVVTRFAQETFDSFAVNVIYHPGAGSMTGDSWEVRHGNKGAAATYDLTAAMSQTYGTNRMSGLLLLEKALNLQQPAVYDIDPDDKTRIFNPTDTTQAKVAQQKIRDAFDQWVRLHPDVQETLAKTYNEINNSHVLRKYDGQFLQFPWLASGYELFPEKKDVVWRAIQDGRALIAHGVGGGKTIIGTAIALELKRLGHARKPLIVVHNATLEQFAATITSMAPFARVLVARKKELAGPKRKEFMARIAAGDWDAIVMAHSSFNIIPDDPDYERKILWELKDELWDAINEASSRVEDKSKNLGVKEMQKQLLRLEERIKKVQTRKTDNVLTFQELGIDALILDEAHLYKKLAFTSKLNRIAGIDKASSERGMGLLTKTRYLQERNRGRNVFTMTGTPVTNTLGESWNMVRLVAPDLLKEFRVECFDRFVSTFAEIVTSAELGASGAYKQIERLAALSNLPEWNKFFRLASDVKMGTDMQVRGRPEIKGGKPELVALEQTPQVEKFTQFIQEVIDDYEHMEGKEKKEHSYLPLLTYNAAKLSAIDIRLVDPNARDEAGSKVNRALEKVAELYERTSDYHGTQVIFCDSFRPMQSTLLDLSDADLEPALETGPDNEREALRAGGFNLYHDMRTKLVAKGIPVSEIALISDYKKDDQKERLFEQVNEGKIRVVIGGTQRLGTGVNMQRRMIAAHHLDVPWTPAELEQRDGRVYRQGNIHSELGVPVEIYRYGMKDTLDAALWQKLETKERFIKQAVSGKINARSIEDDTGLLSLAEQKAVLSGEMGMRKFTADQRVRELEAEEWAWRKSMVDAGYNARQAEWQMKSKESDLLKMQSAAQAVEKWTGVDQPVLQMNGQTATGAKEATELLKAVFEKRFVLIRSLDKSTRKEQAKAPLGKALFNGTEIELGRPDIIENLGETKLELRWRMEVPITIDGTLVGFGNSPGWILRRLQDFPLALQEKIESAQHTIDRCQEQIKAATAEMEKSFPKAAELEAALQEQAEVMRLLTPEENKAPVAVLSTTEQSGQESKTMPEPAPAEDSSALQQTAPMEVAEVTQDSKPTAAPKPKWKSSLMREIEAAQASMPMRDPAPAPRRNVILARSLLRELGRTADALNVASPAQMPHEPTPSPLHESTNEPQKRRGGMRV